MWAADRADHATGAARQRRERRLRAHLRYARVSVAMAQAESNHHAALWGQNMARAGGWVRDALHGEVPEQPTPQEPGTQYYGLGDDDSVPEIGGARPTPFVEVRPQGKVERHAGIGFKLVTALDALVLQMVDQLVYVLQFFDTFRPVVAEQVNEVPKTVLEDNIPQRTALREPQLVEHLVEVPTEPAFVEQTVDIPVPGGRGRLHLRDFLPEQSSTVCGSGGSQGLRPGQGSAACVGGVFMVFPQDWIQQRHPQFLALQLLRSTTRMNRLTVFFFSHFSPAPKNCVGRRALECGAGCALDQTHPLRMRKSPRPLGLTTATCGRWCPRRRVLAEPPHDAPSGSRRGSASRGGASESVHRPWGSSSWTWLQVGLWVWSSTKAVEEFQIFLTQSWIWTIFSTSPLVSGSHFTAVLASVCSCVWMNFTHFLMFARTNWTSFPRIPCIRWWYSS